MWGLGSGPAPEATAEAVLRGAALAADALPTGLVRLAQRLAQAGPENPHPPGEQWAEYLLIEALVLCGVEKPLHCGMPPGKAFGPSQAQECGHVAMAAREALREGTSVLARLSRRHRARLLRAVCGDGPATVASPPAIDSGHEWWAAPGSPVCGHVAPEDAVQAIAPRGARHRSAIDALRRVLAPCQATEKATPLPPKEGQRSPHVVADAETVLCWTHARQDCGEASLASQCVHILKSWPSAGPVAAARRVRLEIVRAGDDTQLLGAVARAAQDRLGRAAALRQRAAAVATARRCIDALASNLRGEIAAYELCARERMAASSAPVPSQGGAVPGSIPGPTDAALSAAFVDGPDPVGRRGSYRRWAAAVVLFTLAHCPRRAVSSSAVDLALMRALWRALASGSEEGATLAAHPDGGDVAEVALGRLVPHLADALISYDGATSRIVEWADAAVQQHAAEGLGSAVPAELRSIVAAVCVLQNRGVSQRGRAPDAVPLAPVVDDPLGVAARARRQGESWAAADAAGAARQYLTSATVDAAAARHKLRCLRAASWDDAPQAEARAAGLETDRLVWLPEGDRLAGLCRELVQDPGAIVRCLRAGGCLWPSSGPQCATAARALHACLFQHESPPNSAALIHVVVSAVEAEMHGDGAGPGSRNPGPGPSTGCWQLGRPGTLSRALLVGVALEHPGTQTFASAVAAGAWAALASSRGDMGSSGAHEAAAVAALEAAVSHGSLLPRWLGRVTSGVAVRAQAFGMGHRDRRWWAGTLLCRCLVCPALSDPRALGVRPPPCAAARAAALVRGAQAAGELVRARLDAGPGAGDTVEDLVVSLAAAAAVDDDEDDGRADQPPSPPLVTNGRTLLPMQEAAALVDLCSASGGFAELTAVSQGLRRFQAGDAVSFVVAETGQGRGPSPASGAEDVCSPAALTRSSDCLARALRGGPRPPSPCAESRRRFMSAVTAAATVAHTLNLSARLDDLAATGDAGATRTLTDVPAHRPAAGGQGLWECGRDDCLRAARIAADARRAREEASALLAMDAHWAGLASDAS